MTLKSLLSILLVYRSNFQLLHWNAKGRHFDKIHSLAADYYDKTLNDADIVAEMAMRVGETPVNYMEAADALKNLDGEFVMVSSNIKYDMSEFTKITGIMLKDILKAIESVLATELIQKPENVGIKAALESMHNEYDLQARYLNANRVE